MDLVEKVAREIALEHGGTRLETVGGALVTVAVRAGYGSTYGETRRYSNERWTEYESAAREAIRLANGASL